MKNFQITLAALIIFFGTAVGSANAATIFVTNTNDSGEGSLRQAIAQANTNNEEDIIEFDPSVFNVPRTIVLTSGNLNVISDNASGSTKKLTINGTGANMLTITGNNQSRVFTITAARAVLNGMKITGGNGLGTSVFPSGGGILVDSGLAGENEVNLTLINSIVTENKVLQQFFSGGGIFVIGARMTIINSTISHNESASGGGGILTQANSITKIINSTISHNTTGTDGGGIRIWETTNVSLTNVTIAFNKSTGSIFRGGGIYRENNSTLRMRNTVVAANTAIYGSDVYGAFLSEGYNILGNATDAFPSGDLTGNQLNVNPQLDPQLRTNGGIIPSHALGANSPAIDQGNNCVLNTPAAGGCLDPNITTDARGIARPQDGNGDGTATVDVGAFEALRAEILITPNAPDLKANNDTGASDSDNITMSRNLTFDISGVSVGAVVEFFRGNEKIGETTATGNTATFSDLNLPANGTFLYSVRQTVNNQTSLFSGSLAVTIDNTAPAVTINQAAGQADPTSVQPINFTVVFNETVSGFDSADVSLSNSTAGVASATIAVSGSNTIYNAAIGNVTADGLVRADVLANAALDLAGNSSGASTSTDNTVTLDTTPPTVTINQAANQADPTRNSTVNFTVVFSEVVNTFSSAGVTLAGSTANVSSASIIVTGSGTTYNVAVNNITSNGGFVRATVVPSAALDLVGLPNVTYSTSTDNQVTVDNISPTVTINQAVGQSDPTNTLPVNYTVVFSEPVTGFDSADISLSGSTVNTSGATITVTGSGTTYNVAIGNITANNGIVRASVRSSAATDVLGNFSFASTSTDNSVSIDNVAPRVSINQAIGQSDPTSTSPINFTVIFSELVSGFSAADVSLAGSTADVSAATVIVSGSGSVYNVAIGNILSSGQVRASVAANAAQDAVGNLSSASTSTDNIVTFNARRAAFDFDGDGKSDLSVFRPDDGAWYLQQSTAGFTGIAFGLSTDKIVPADYDGDGKTDLAVFRNGTWYLQRSQAGFTGLAFGSDGDVPQPADFDGDGKAELAVYRPSNGTWYTYNLVTNQTNAVQFGASEDKPVAGDYDGDGRADYAVFRPSTGTWYLQNSTLGFTGVAFGQAEDKPVAADYDGDGKTDVAVFRPSNGTWYMLRSTLGFAGIAFGIGTDQPVPADYDGDGKADVAVFRNGTWYLQRSTQGFTGATFGAATDKAVPNAFVP